MIKNTLLLLIALMLANITSAQIFSDKQIDSCKAEVSVVADSLKLYLEQGGNFYSDYEKELTVQFDVDTFKIEQLSILLMEINYSTSAMMEATLMLEKNYDLLLNKYYKTLYNKLNNDDKLKLKESQRNWIQFRDSERKMNMALSKDEYSGGGTIQPFFLASKLTSITRTRVIELYGYLHRFSQ